MGRGIVVPDAGPRRPSEHFAGHFPGASSALTDFVAGLIDGSRVTLTDPLDVMPWQISSTFAQFAAVDTAIGEDRAFAIACAALTPEQLRATPHPDPRGVPALLGAFHNGADWDAYNCYIVDFQVWSLQSLYRGTWPKIPRR